MIDASIVVRHMLGSPILRPIRSEPDQVVRNPFRPGRGLRNSGNCWKARGPESGGGNASISISVVESVVLICHASQRGRRGRGTAAGLFGSARANALAAVDARYHRNALIVADLSNDASYADVLVETFGVRVIGLQIGRFGNGIDAEIRSTSRGRLPVYNVGRTFLIELHGEFQADRVRLGNSPEVRRASQQLADLQLGYRDTGAVNQCASGRHDDLAISLAMLGWAARHPHLESWTRNMEAARRPRRPRPTYSWQAWT